MDVNAVIEKDDDDKKKYIGEHYDKKVKTPVISLLKSCESVLKEDDEYKKQRKDLENTFMKTGVFIFSLGIIGGIISGALIPSPSTNSETPEAMLAFINIGHNIMIVMVGFISGVFGARLLINGGNLFLKKESIKEKEEKDNLIFKELVKGINEKPLSIEYQTLSQLEAVYNACTNNNFVNQYLKDNLKKMKENAHYAYCFEWIDDALIILENKPSFLNLTVKDRFCFFYLFNQMGKAPYEIKFAILTEINI